MGVFSVVAWQPFFGLLAANAAKIIAFIFFFPMYMGQSYRTVLQLEPRCFITQPW